MRAVFPVQQFDLAGGIPRFTAKMQERTLFGRLSFEARLVNSAWGGDTSPMDRVTKLHSVVDAWAHQMRNAL